jgi:AcrR family transcriptional regulator
MNDPNPKPKRVVSLVDGRSLRGPRRTNVERRATTQREVLQATIDCLHRLGYGATTTYVVAETAGLSRGTMLHHFPTKAALMVAATRYAWECEIADLQTAVAQFESGLPRMRALIDAHWDIVQRPEDIAVHEVRIGSRSDPEVATAVHPVMVAISKEYARFVGGLIRQAGLEPTEELRGLTVTWTMALPMMSFYRAADPNSRMIESLLATLKKLQEDLIERQQVRPKPSE